MLSQTNKASEQNNLEVVTKPMRAVVVDSYGAASRLRVEHAVIPTVGNAEVLVRVCAAAVCRGDAYLLSGKPYLIRVSGYGLFRPRHRIPGQGFSGEIVAVGSLVNTHRVGDLVFGETPFGAFAEFVAVKADLLAPKPANLSHKEAAALTLSGSTALQSIRDAGRIVSGQQVLINGASGSVGTLAVQIAKALGAHVTAVCSTRHKDLLQSLGADEIIDYTRSDFTRSSKQYDVIIDLVANHTMHDYKRVLKANGRYIGVALSMKDDWLGPIIGLLRVAIANHTSSANFCSFIAKPNHSDFAHLARMAENGLLNPVIERQYALKNIAQAIEHVASGHSQGATVVQITDGESCR